jgi:phosphohistidine phosphatase
MVELLVWRHAKTETAKDGTADHERRLLPVGQDDAIRMGRLLADRGLIPDLVLCSDAVRARQTADLAMQAWNHAPTRIDLPELYRADAPDYLSIVSVYGGTARRVLIVAHNPAVGDFASEAAGKPIRIRTGTLAVVEVDVRRAADASRASALTLRSVLETSR